MLATIATVVTILNGIWTFFKNLFGGKSSTDNTEDAASAAVKMSNEAGHESAEVARETESATQKGLDDADHTDDADLDRVHDAGSLRDAQAGVDDAIARANQNPDSNG